MRSVQSLASDLHLKLDVYISINIMKSLSEQKGQYRLSYTTINFTDEFRNVSVTLCLWRKWAWLARCGRCAKSRPEYWKL